MTAQEAIDYLLDPIGKREQHDEAIGMAVYALEKQIQKKPGYTKLKYICNGKDIEFNHPECPFCRTHGLSLWDAAIPVGDKFCKRCGQAIAWEEGEQNERPD